ncbi:MAG: alpha/beta fold hydrolase [Planctomycetes bacterium]|nr:alpha/beta fold hydrolase [Planctomycetota bacterium]MBI3848343.1 alpha/beta fold hydrolase [Planctomycetota bacterium]
MSILGAVVAAALLAGPAERVTFESDDHVKLVADLYAGGKPNARAVILLPMYGDTRASWKRLAPLIQQKGMTALALDPRGHGESLHQGDKVLDYNSARQGGENLFLSMYRDVAAAKKYLVEKAGIDASRVSLVGASIGCSVAIDSAGRDHSLKSMVLMSPGRNYQGMDSMAHASKVAALPVLILTNDRESAAARDVAGAMPKGAAQVDVIPDAEHGTRMLGKVEGIEKKIVDFLEKNG